MPKTDVAAFLKTFIEPDPRYSPAPLWWWSGDKLQWPRMKWQMDQMSAMGIRNFVIMNLAPGGTLFGSDSDNPHFLTEEWWSYFKLTCDYARDMGIYIWFYDQIGFSGANYQAEIAAKHPEYLGQRLRSLTIEGEGTLELTCPGASTPIGAYVFVKDKSNEIKYVPFENNKASVNAGELSVLRIVYASREGYDLFSREACDKLLDTVHREFARRLPEHIGKTIVGSFQDELPDLPTWGTNFCQAFNKQFGYQIEEVIHHLFEEGDIDHKLTRIHFQQLRANLAIDAFFKPFDDWHKEHGLLCGFDQQGTAREGRAKGCVDKYADYTLTHRYYGAPGCDLHGSAHMHGSLAFLGKKSRVWMEGFHSTGWGGTIADTFDWLIPYLQGGSNLYNPHAIYYSTHKGWWEWAPPSTCFRQPYAKHYKAFADMIARLTKIVSQGTMQATVGVLFPTATVQGAMTIEKSFADADLADQTFHEVIGSSRWHEFMTGPLDVMSIDFHVLDEPSIRESNIYDGGMTINEVGIKTIILPNVTLLDSRVVQKLVDLAKSGGKIIVIGNTIVTDEKKYSLDLLTLPNVVRIEKAAELKAVLKEQPREIHSPYAYLHRKVGAYDVLFLPALTGMATEVKWANWNAPIEVGTINPKRYNATAILKLPVEITRVHQFDPITGESRVLAIQSGELVIDFAGSPFTVLVWSKEDRSTPNTSPTTESISAQLSDEWNCVYEPTLPTEYTDIYDPDRPWQRLPYTADFDWEYGEERQTVRATFGVRAFDSSGKPIIYSPEFGIQKDMLHQGTLGPKAHVPEEFLRFENMKSGQTQTIKTGVISDRNQSVLLAIGSFAKKGATVNQKNFAQTDNTYLWTAPIDLKASDNPIEIHLTPERDMTVRAFWCLIDRDRADEFIRPERIVPGGEIKPGSRVVIRKLFQSDYPITSGQIKISTSAQTRIFINDQPIGQQGGFDPYHPQFRGVTHTIPPLPAGDHQVRLEITESPSQAFFIIDLLGQTKSGEKISVISDSTWTYSRDNQPELPMQIHTRGGGDSTAWHLYRRDHSLLKTAWIEGKQSGVVLDLPLIPPSKEQQSQTFKWIIPPGATSIKIQLIDASDVKLKIEGIDTKINNGNVDLASGKKSCREAILTLKSNQLGGGVFSRPITYEYGTGILITGDWCAQGLRAYSGAIRMQQSITLDPINGRPIVLDLGHIRGTVEAFLNGKSLGVRFLSPYRFDLTNHALSGENNLELLVTNTLVNHLSSWSPTHVWATDQIHCGIFGPVTICS